MLQLCGWILISMNWNKCHFPLKWIPNLDLRLPLGHMAPQVLCHHPPVALLENSAQLAPWLSLSLSLVVKYIPSWLAINPSATFPWNPLTVSLYLFSADATWNCSYWKMMLVPLTNVTSILIFQPPWPVRQWRAFNPYQNSPVNSPNPSSYSSQVLLKSTDPSCLLWTTSHPPPPLLVSQ